MDSDSQLSDERYKVFIDDIDNAVYELDTHGNFSYFNDSLCKIFGYSREEIQGAKCRARKKPDTMASLYSRKDSLRNSSRARQAARGTRISEASPSR